MKRLLALLLLPALGGCTVVGASATWSSSACPAGMQAAQRAELYMGRGLRSGGEISTADIDAFVAGTLAPAFPDGFSLIQARGQWRAADGHVARESSLVAIVLLPGATGEQARDQISPVAEAWRRRFGQESVLKVIGPSCIAF